MNTRFLRLLWATRNRWPLWVFGTLSLLLLAMPSTVLTFIGGVLGVMHDHIMAKLHKLMDRYAPPTKEAWAVAREIDEVEDALDEAARQDADEIRALLQRPNECN